MSSGKENDTASESFKSIDEVLDDEPKSILLGIISQLSKGMDLHRVTLPVFILEPRSMLERITDFMSHPEFLLNTSVEQDPIQRFIQVVRYFLSGWHIRPKSNAHIFSKGVKKPYNPVLGEIFRCKYKLEDGSSAFYLAEQCSHHPPVSTYFYANPDRNLVITGNVKPKSKFLGNSAASLMNGESYIYFGNIPNEVYVITMPNMYARGILFGTMSMELGDNATIKCEATGLCCEIEFKTKGFFSGSHNAIQGKIKNKEGKVIYQISGKWTDVIYLHKMEGKTEISKEIFFSSAESRIQPKIVQDEEKQSENESRRLWSKVTSSLLRKDYDAATNEKTLIENVQREQRKLREAEDVEYQPHFFHPVGDNNFQFNHYHPERDNIANMKQKLLEIIFPSHPDALESKHA